MGIDRDGAAFLAAARRDGVDFGSTLTIGRQNVSADESALAAAGRIAGVPPLTVRPEFAEPFLRTLGAETTDAIDASDFEDATHVHDSTSQYPTTSPAATRPWSTAGRSSTSSTSARRSRT